MLSVQMAPARMQHSGVTCPAACRVQGSECRDKPSTWADTWQPRGSTTPDQENLRRVPCAAASRV